MKLQGVFGISLVALAMPASGVSGSAGREPTEAEVRGWEDAVARKNQEGFVAELVAISRQDFKLTLYSIAPKEDRDWLIEGRKPWEEVFRGYPILGRAETTDAEDRRRVLAALIQGLRESDLSGAGLPEHRYAITVTSGGRKIDMVVGFGSRSGRVWGAYATWEFFTSASPETLFDQLLKKYGLPRPARVPASVEKVP